MAPPPLVSPATGSDAASSQTHFIHADDSAGFFRDVAGRCLFLRGINLASSAKTPIGQPGHQLEGFWERAEGGELSFVNRVLDLDLDPADEHSADQHLRRLKSWGFNTLRYVTTWESIEHRGPGQYDQAYIDYTVRMLRKCKEHGFLVYMDPHQDLWSRFSGGSGAPLWTLLACGLNPRNFTVTNAAVIQCEWPDPSAPDPANFPDMIWASNYTRLAVMTLMTLFFAGKHYAPLCQIDGINIQDYLQQHYLDAYRKLAEAIRDAGDLNDICVIGWDSINEPNHGLLGLEDVTVQPDSNLAKIGPMPTAFEAMKLGMGIATEVESWKFGSLGAKKEGTVLIDPKGAKAWLNQDQDLQYSLKYGWKRSSEWPAGVCIWALHGLWDTSTQQALKTDYFSNKERTIEFSRDFWLPHFVTWAKMIRSIHSEAILFVLPEVFSVPPSFKDSTELVELLRKRACLSTHFYDGLTLITKHWNWFNADAIGLIRGKYASLPLAIRVGPAAIRKVMRDQLAYLRQDTFDTMGNYPTMMGEIGIPYDLDKKEAYRTGIYRNQSHALDASLNACDGTNLFNYTMWTYNPENTYQWGENWNGEDLSVWSLDDFKRNAPSTSENMSMLAVSSTNLIAPEESPEQEARLNRGARAIEAFVRPYPTAVAGRPISIEFDVASSLFTLVIETLPDDLRQGMEELPTEIYLPAVHYGELSQEDVAELEEESEEQEQKKMRRRMSRPGSAPSSKPHALHLPHIQFPWHRHKPRLALAVHVTRGHYEIVGHTLKWYHRSPTNLRLGPSPKPGEPRRETITIRRKGGPRPEVTAAFGEKPRSLGQVLWDALYGMCCVS